MTPAGRFRAAMLLVAACVLFLVAGLMLGAFDPKPVRRPSSAGDAPELAGPPRDWMRRANELDQTAAKPGVDAIDARDRHSAADRLRRRFELAAQEAISFAKHALRGSSAADQKDALAALDALGSEIPPAYAKEVAELRRSLGAR